MFALKFFFPRSLCSASLKGEISGSGPRSLQTSFSSASIQWNTRHLSRPGTYLIQAPISSRHPSHPGKLCVNHCLSFVSKYRCRKDFTLLFSRNKHILFTSRVALSLPHYILYLVDNTHEKTRCPYEKARCPNWGTHFLHLWYLEYCHQNKYCTLYFQLIRVFWRLQQPPSPVQARSLLSNLEESIRFQGTKIHKTVNGLWKQPPFR